MIHEPRRFACICTRQLPNCDFSGSACGYFRTMRIEEGRYYRDSLGRKVGPMVMFDAAHFFEAGHPGVCWTAHGAAYGSAAPLISEWKPVSTIHLLKKLFSGGKHA